MRNRVKPKAGQESVWDYPRPPRVEACHKTIRIMLNDLVLVQTSSAFRVLETSHPPVFYVPQEDIQMRFLEANTKQSFCEFKGAATYWNITLGDGFIANAAWSYPKPTKGFEAIKDYLAFYPSKMQACFVDDERVQAQEGDFYGGWITKTIVGPFKGGSGTWGW